MGRGRFVRAWVVLALAAMLAAIQVARAEVGYNDGRVMIQGFMWESHQDGKQRGEGGHEYEVHWQGKWYAHVAGKVDELAAAKFDIIWLPPPSRGEGAGYHPKEYYDFSNNYGDEAAHRALLVALLGKGIAPVADLVINHRQGSGSWAAFKNPDWPAHYICSNDEFWFQKPADLNPQDQAILAAGKKGAPDYGGSNYPNWHGARDLDHTNPDLRRDIKAFLIRLKKFGYLGWRYDMVKGFAPEYVAEYNYASKPFFAVGEYWDANPDTLTAWIDGTKWKGQPDPALKACCAFDFATQELLKQYINNGQYTHLPAITFKDGVADGLIAVNRDKAVTFLENHDTGFPQKQFDSFPRDHRVVQGYAYILTHPGIPCVYWKHYFDWGLGPEIRRLIRARKYAGVHSGSHIKTEVHGPDYVAIVGDKPQESSTLIVKIGPGFGFNPDNTVWELETSGWGYAVWVRRSMKKATKDAVDKPRLPFDVPAWP